MGAWRQIGVQLEMGNRERERWGHSERSRGHGERWEKWSEMEGAWSERHCHKSGDRDAVRDAGLGQKWGGHGHRWRYTVVNGGDLQRGVQWEYNL